MKVKTRTFLLASLAMAGVIFIPLQLSSARSRAPQSWTAYAGPPPHDWYLSPIETYYKTINGGPWNVAFSSDFPAARASIDWTYIPTGAVLSQKFPLTYWVSAVALDSDGLGFVVAGKRRNGNTVIDHYRTSLPSPPGSFPATAQAVSVENIYDESTEGRDIVCMIESIDFTGDKVHVVQFYDSRNLYVIDHATPASPTVTLLASKDISSSSPYLVPELADRPFFEASVFNHLTEGTVLILGSHYGADSNIVIADIGQDAGVDYVVSISDTNWAASVYAPDSNYVNWP